MNRSMLASCSAHHKCITQYRFYGVHCHLAPGIHVLAGNEYLCTPLHAVIPCSRYQWITHWLKHPRLQKKMSHMLNIQTLLLQRMTMTPALVVQCPLLYHSHIYPLVSSWACHWGKFSIYIVIINSVGLPSHCYIELVLLWEFLLYIYSPLCIHPQQLRAPLLKIETCHHFLEKEKAQNQKAIKQCDTQNLTCEYSNLCYVYVV